MKIKMTKTKDGSSDGINIDTYEKGKKYDVSDSLAENFVGQGVAKEDKEKAPEIEEEELIMEEEKAPEGEEEPIIEEEKEEAPENKEKAPENKGRKKEDKK